MSVIYPQGRASIITDMYTDAPSYNKKINITHVNEV